MAKSRLGLDVPEGEEMSRALKLLQEAQAVIDKMDRPHIGARLQEVIDALLAERRG